MEDIRSRLRPLLQTGMTGSQTPESSEFSNAWDLIEYIVRERGTLYSVGDLLPAPSGDNEQNEPDNTDPIPYEPGVTPRTREEVLSLPFRERIITEVILSHEFIQAGLNLLNCIWQTDVKVAHPECVIFTDRYGYLIPPVCKMLFLREIENSWIIVVRYKTSDTNAVIENDIASRAYSYGNLNLGTPQPRYSNPCRSTSSYKNHISASPPPSLRPEPRELRGLKGGSSLPPSWPSPYGIDDCSERPVSLPPPSPRPKPRELPGLKGESTSPLTTSRGSSLPPSWPTHLGHDERSERPVSLPPQSPRSKPLEFPDAKGGTTSEGMPPPPRRSSHIVSSNFTYGSREKNADAKASDSLLHAQHSSDGHTSGSEAMQKTATAQSNQENAMARQTSQNQVEGDQMAHEDDSEVVLHRQSSQKLQLGLQSDLTAQPVAAGRIDRHDSCYTPVAPKVTSCYTKRLPSSGLYSGGTKSITAAGEASQPKPSHKTKRRPRPRAWSPDYTKDVGIQYRLQVLQQASQKRLVSDPMARSADEDEVVPASQNEGTSVNPKKNVEHLMKHLLFGTLFGPSAEAPEDLTEVGQLDFRPLGSRSPDEGMRAEGSPSLLPSLIPRDPDTLTGDMDTELDEDTEERPAKRQKTASESAEEEPNGPLDKGVATTTEASTDLSNNGKGVITRAMIKRAASSPPVEEAPPTSKSSIFSSTAQATTPLVTPKPNSRPIIEEVARSIFSIPTIPTPTRPTTFNRPQRDDLDVDPETEMNARLLSQRDDPVLAMEQVVRDVEVGAGAVEDGGADVEGDPVFVWPDGLLDAEEEEEEVVPGWDMWKDIEIPWEEREHVIARVGDWKGKGNAK
ncbi:hypothetical protein T440DRAFT_539502 [Plenodomus tracheiphilus IPT5]|uniref:Uncharacterized protein n=1 Tax=Plenodomus tracheiphilus IPT5 TaxID=1408161 RepID=A0A6A7BIR9_9PLEO|nr:hypothetical protein T440DRAFT_539502 [Plenodomus tracheiphilus IPT5]